ncbi:MAG: 4Fe-4S dicluster domain-containing protein [Vicinamibacterales bacterium]
MELHRREFIDRGLRVLVLSAPAAVAWDHLVAGAPEQSPNYRVEDHWWGFAIDIDRCIGCGLCVRACKEENDVPLEPYLFRTWVERYVIDPADREHPRVDSLNGGFDGFEPPPGSIDGMKTFFVPKLCNHCADSPCVQVCPVGATFHTPDGVVLVDKERCLGCSYCVQACPYGCRYIDPRTHTADKCTLCYHRITKGLTTACCEVCPTGARMLGDLKNPKDPIHEFLRDRAVHVLKPQMATHSKTWYAGLDGAVR